MKWILEAFHRIKVLWLKLSPEARKEIQSGWQTFFVGFIGAILIQHGSGDGIVWTRDALASLILAAGRSGFKAFDIWLWAKITQWYIQARKKNV